MGGTATVLAVGLERESDGDRSFSDAFVEHLESAEFGGASSAGAELAARTVRTPEDTREAIAADAVDVVVVRVDSTASATDAVGTVREADGTVPVVCAGAGADLDPAAVLAAGAADVVRLGVPPTAGDAALLARRATAALIDGDTREGTADRIDRLQAIAAELDSLESVREIYRHAVSAADRVLDFDACAVAQLEDGSLRVRAGRAPELHLDADPLASGEGVAGRTIAEGRARRIDDLRDHAGARPIDQRYRSCLSVPLGDDGVFQALATRSGAFAPTDVEFVELLCTQIEHALDRVTYQAELTEERDRFGALFENVPDAAVQYVVEDGSLRIEEVNAAFVRLFGYDPGEAAGASVLDLLVPEADHESTAGIHASIADGERVEREVERMTVDGTNPFLLRSVPVASADGADRGYLIYTDISTQKARERELERQNERLDEFASIVSHDLRNPLSIALGHADLATDREPAEHVPTIKAELERMERMIGELLALAREGKVVGETELTALAAAAEAAWDHVSTGDASLEIGDLPRVDADPDRVEELLENCYRNAVQHAGPAVSIVVDGIVGDGGELVGFYVADDGPGIPDAEKEQVLERGFTTASEGTGIGLSIVSEIAEGHGWCTHVTDAADGGARIEIYTDPDARPAA